MKIIDQSKYLIELDDYHDGGEDHIASGSSGIIYNFQKKSRNR